MLVVLSVMSGFHEDLQKKILGVNAHLVVLSYRGVIIDYKEVIDNLRDDRDILSAAPFVLGQAMVSIGERTHGIFVRGLILRWNLKLQISLVT